MRPREPKEHKRKKHKYKIIQGHGQLCLCTLDDYCTCIKKLTIPEKVSPEVLESHTNVVDSLRNENK